MPTIQSTDIFATAPNGAKSPDSITSGNGSIWVQYGNGAKSDGSGGSSTIVQYDLLGNTQNTYTVAGSDDGLKVDPATGNVWVLQNQDGNSTLTFIDPKTNQASAPLSYASPYTYGRIPPAATTTSPLSARKCSRATPTPSTPATR